MELHHAFQTETESKEEEIKLKPLKMKRGKYISRPKQEEGVNIS